MGIDESRSEDHSISVDDPVVAFDAEILPNLVDQSIGNPDIRDLVHPRCWVNDTGGTDQYGRECGVWHSER